MRLSSLWYGSAALAVVAALPAPAAAQLPAQPTTCYYSLTMLGLGGALQGCVFGTATQLGEEAGLVSQMSWFTGDPGQSGVNNTPITPGTFLFNDDCGSGGGAGDFQFCNPASSGNFGIVNDELVFGLNVPDVTYDAGGYWDYTGAASRNAIPDPPGFQAVLLQVQHNGVDVSNTFVLGWEDLNSGCTAENPASVDIEDQTSSNPNNLSNASFMDTYLHHCSGGATTGDSDRDYNDFYVELVLNQGDILSTTPEPMTMSLMALGLVGLGGASLRRRNRKS